MRSSPSILRRLLGAPALHFLVLGGALFAGDRWLQAGIAVEPDLAARTIRITATDRARLREEWAREWGRPPTAEEERALVRQTIDEEVLWREAVARGLDRDDRVVRTRLAQLAEFVGEAGEEEDLARRARRLGLDQSDVVVRRYLVQAMRLVAGRPGAGDGVTDADLAAWYAEHRERFRRPASVDLVQVYLSRDRRGTRLERDAATLLARLRRERVPPERAADFGDPFIRGATMTAASPADLERAFGPEFAAAVAAIPSGGWNGPIASAYGLHLVWVRARRPSQVPALAAVRGQALHGLLKEREEARARRRLAEWRRRYVIVVEGGDA